MPRPTKRKQTEQDKRDDMQARLVALMNYLRIMRVQTEGRADVDVTLMTIGEAEREVRSIKRMND